jgi:hypothetical protein
MKVVGMSIEISCPGCGRKLQIEAVDQGKQIRCPVCQQISVVPAYLGDEQTAEGEMAAEAGQAATIWHMRTPEGPIYGPVSWAQIQSWGEEGRIAADCELADSSSGPWRAATALIPELSGSQSVIAPQSAPPNYPYDAAGAAESRAYVAPHRGGLVVFLGILGIGFIGMCPPFSPILGLITWVMASRDLADMRAGLMDKSGEQLTQAGWVLGLILSLLWLIALVSASLMALLVGLASYW